jgi:hypothetical protein
MLGMILFAVTVRLEKNPLHDPKNKKTGPCPISAVQQLCDDVTGEHHTFLHVGTATLTVENIRAAYETIYHITRVEEVTLP